MDDAIRGEAIRRGITRLCHFTPSSNFVRIMGDIQGIRATQDLINDERAEYQLTDKDRHDGYLDHVCCSIVYPNPWYFREARKNNPDFKAWVVLYLETHYLWAPGTLFCPTNAATKKGEYVRKGFLAFKKMFAPSTPRAYGRTCERNRGRPAFLPTDSQAEVLIPDYVSREDIFAIGVKDKPQAEREISRLKNINVQLPYVVIAPGLFAPGDMFERMLRFGRTPIEREYKRREHNG